MQRMLGNYGRNVRPLPEPPELDEDGQPVVAEQGGEGPSLPATCLRRMTSPRPDPCPGDCPGLQRDGGCLCDVVAAANEQGAAWAFEIDREGRWAYTGEALA